MTGFKSLDLHSALVTTDSKWMIRLEVRAPNVMSGAKTATQGREEELSWSRSPEQRGLRHEEERIKMFLNDKMRSLTHILCHSYSNGILRNVLFVIVGERGSKQHNRCCQVLPQGKNQDSNPAFGEVPFKLILSHFSIFNDRKAVINSRENLHSCQIFISCKMR